VSNACRQQQVERPESTKNGLETLSWLNICEKLFLHDDEIDADLKQDPLGMQTEKNMT